MSEQIHKLIDVNGQLLYVDYEVNYANHPTIIFLHDSLGCVALWRDFPKKLAAMTRCNVLVYDRLGYGKSAPMPTFVRPVNYMDAEADTLRELLRILKIDSAIFFGHSDGGTIALLTANKYPEIVKAVICEAAHIFVEDITLKGIYEAMVAYRSTDLRVRLQKYHGDKVETLFKAWSETWTREDFRTWDIQSLLPNVVCPLLFLQGSADEFGTLNQVEKTVTQVSGIAQKFIIPNVGHTPHKEVPETVLEKATEFIQMVIR